MLTMIYLLILLLCAELGLRLSEWMTKSAPRGYEDETGFHYGE